MLLDWALATPRYRATAILEIQKESHGAFGLENTTTDRPTSAVSDSFDDNLTLQTEIGILQSDALTLDVIRRAGLEATPDYFGRRPGGFAFLHCLAFWRKPLEPLSTPLAEAPNRRYVALRIFAAHRKIAPQAGTRLIAVSYSDPDPARAARVVQSLVQALSDYGFPVAVLGRGAVGLLAFRAAWPRSSSRPTRSTHAPPRSTAPPATTATILRTIPCSPASTR